MRFRYKRYFCRWLATFSRVMPSTFISCRMVFGTASFTPCARDANIQLRKLRWHCQTQAMLFKMHHSTYACIATAGTASGRTTSREA